MCNITVKICSPFVLRKLISNLNSRLWLVDAAHENGFKLGINKKVIYQNVYFKRSRHHVHRYASNSV